MAGDWISLRIYCVVVIFVWSCVKDIAGQANYCNVNGVTRQVGQSWITVVANEQLKKCTCARRGQWNCAYVHEDALLVVADVRGIAKIKISDAAGFKTPFLHNLSGRTVAVDIDIESDTIYWTDVSFEKRGIYKASFSKGQNVRRFITNDVYEPNGIAVDWLAKNIYWTDAQMRAIYVATDTGQHKTMLVGGLSEPRGITILPLHGRMFWTDQEAGTIESATMDGNNRKIIMGGLGWPNEIAVDPMRNKIYWIDGKKRTIESCNFDGSSWKKIIDFNITFNSPGYGLSLLGGRLYFSVWRKKAVYSVTLLGQDLKLVAGNLNENLAGIAIVNKAMQQAPIFDSVGPCRRHRNPCSHICLPRSRSQYTCACPERSGLVLSQDLHTCKVPEEFLLYTSIYDGSIVIVSKEFGTKPHPTVLTHSSQPSAIDFDPIDKMIYWSDVALNGIYRMAINGSAHGVFLEDGIATVDGIAIDWVNRYLYFTNYGWESHEKEFARIEMISLDGIERKVLLQRGLDKPRDLLIDQQRGFLYFSDWGKDAKVVRVDLDGKNPRLMPILVENPNGLALNNAILYVTDSHRKSAFLDSNGTVTYGRSPSLITYDTAVDKLKENMDLDLEIPFGLTMDEQSLYVTDWGMKTISEINMKTGVQQQIATSISKPTGIVRASLQPKKQYSNDCAKNKNKCSHMCVPVDQNYSSCICPDHVGKALSEDDSSCVAPDQFILVADVNKIIMVSESPEDPSTYLVVRTFDDYSNIVAFAYDPITQFVYWADNGRQKICRKMLASPFGADGGTRKDFEVIYTEIENVEGMALDPENRLLYWTDGVLGTIEMLDLSIMVHATVIENLRNPRAISLDPSVGAMYWTEWGRAAMLMSSKMNGGDPRPLITAGLQWPNGLYYDTGDDKIYVADGAKMEIKSISAFNSFDDTSRVDTLDYFNLNGTIGHIFGLSKLGRHLLFTDWKSGSVFKLGVLEYKMIATNLARPTQIYAHTSTTMSEVKSQCSTSLHDCSHICVPSAGSYKCLCPDHLVLANNLKNCVRPENLHLYTTTLEPLIVREDEMTTAAWADEEDEPTELPSYEQPTIKIARLPDPTTQANLTEFTTVADETTTQMQTTTSTIVTTTTTLPPPPRFPLCENIRDNETAEFSLPLPEDQSAIKITPKLLQLRALNVDDRDLNVTLAETGISRLYEGTHKLLFSATDQYGRTIYCNATIIVKDVSPPKVLYCPADLDVESYDDKNATFITWQQPKFTDNSGRALIIMPSHQPGEFRDGLHSVEYTAFDDAGNSVSCRFMIAVMHRGARCGNPWVPPNSKLSCHSDTDKGDQVCKVACNDGYRLSLKNPEIRCRADLQDVSFDWLPFLDENVCTKPAIGNPQQIITLQYMCPCLPTSEYYDYTYQFVTRRLREAINCQSRQYTLGLCMDAENKMFLECVEGSSVQLIIKVDLGRLEQVDTMPEARRIVKRAVTDILDDAVSGQISVRGSNRKDYPASEDAKLSEVAILCRRGFKTVEDGCVECPRGTYWKDGDCEFCPLHTFQEKSGSSRCMECQGDRGTRNIGSTHRSHCIEMVRQEQISKPSVIVIAASAVGGVVGVAIVVSLLGACWYRRRRRKIAEKQAIERRRRKMRRRSSNGSVDVIPDPAPIAVVSPNVTSKRGDSDGGEFSDDRSSRRSGSSGKRVTIKEEALEHTIPTQEERPPKKEAKRLEPDWRMALAIRNKGTGKKAKQRRLTSNVKDAKTSDNKNGDIDSADSDNSESDSENNTKHAENRGVNQPNSDVEAPMPPEDSDYARRKRNNRLMSSTSDLGDETLSIASVASSRATTPIKGVLKKTRRITSFDDSYTDSTIHNASDTRFMEPRGRNSIRRNARLGSGRSSSLEQGGTLPLAMRRSSSFDQGPGYPQRGLYDRELRMIPSPQRMNGPRHLTMPQMMPGMRQRFMAGPRVMNAPPPGAVIYRHANHPNIRMAFVPMNQAPRGAFPPPSLYGYDDFSDWESGSQSGTEHDMRKPPRHRMPPPGMMPRFPARHPYARIRMQGGPIMIPGHFPPGYRGPLPPRFSHRA